MIYRCIWNPVRNAYWRLLDLDCELRSGLRVQIRNRPDWEMYNEVLVNGEYDLPLDYVLNRHKSGRRFAVVDLGGNVGYFTFRCADKCITRGIGERFSILVVEGAPLMFRELESRVRAQPLLRDKVSLLYGLVGRKTGEAYITDSHLHYSNVACEEPRRGSSRVPFINLENELAGTPTIDLIKCDIEGSEFDFIDNYENLLKKARAAVFEFHRYGRNLQEARDTLTRYGFSRHSVLRDAPLYSIEFYTREL
ncbi:MAG TPA: FkbM family methyltransferase [Chthoniobacterales bacterium]|nr:FkbM family methyltransferase [Chthoniobacterales bacterium]